jgi:tetratricopeptide (TPR) repeat protein
MIGCIKLYLVAGHGQQYQARSPNTPAVSSNVPDLTRTCFLLPMETQLVQHRTKDFELKPLRDVWKHASFLVQVAYNLDWAVGQFEMLEKQAPNCLVKAILLLNISITYSLQAEYRHAEQALKKVLPLHSFMAPLAHYLLGVVRFELNDYEQAQISFKLCAYILKQTDCNRAYHPFGLNFTLSHHLVVENEEISAYEWTLKQKGRYGSRLLHRMPASLVFDTTVLNSELEVCCDRLVIQTARSAGSASTSSVYSEDLSSAIEIIDKPAPAPVRDLTTRTIPVVPWQPLKKSMTPRAAQAEASNIRSLTHFLKYTGPEDQQATRADEPTASPISAPTNTFFSEESTSISTKRTGSVRQIFSQAADQADSASQVLRKVSTLTLKKYVLRSNCDTLD